MKVIVASENPVKIKAVKRAFELYFGNVNIEGIIASSGVSSQPLTDNETLIGARNRVEEIRKRIYDADYWVAIEGGIQARDKALTAFAWVVVFSAGHYGESRTASFMLPEKVAHLIAGGMELGDANDVIFSQTNSKQKDGAVGLLTHNRVDRIELYRQAILLALIPFVNPNYY